MNLSYSPANRNGRLGGKHGQLNDEAKFTAPKFWAATDDSKRSRRVTTPMFRGRVIVHFAEGAREIKLIGKAQLIADLFDG